MKKCQFCAENIQDEAVVCKHCGHDLNPVPAPPATPPHVADATADFRLAAARAEYTRRGYKVTDGSLGSLRMERAATKLSWWWTFGLLFLVGVGAIVYVLAWAIWGVHKTYRVTLGLGPDGAIHEAGDVLAVFDRDRLRAHRNRLRVGGWSLIGVGMFFMVSVVLAYAFDPTFRADTSPVATLAVLLIVGVLPGVGVLLQRASRKASHALDAAPASSGDAVSTTLPAPPMRISASDSTSSR